MLKRVAAACVAGALGTLLWTGEAKADVHGFSWGHATLNGGPRFASDDLEFGMGLNVGYTLGMGLYLGGLFDYFFDHDGLDVWFAGFDCGYDIGIGNKFVIRPSGGPAFATLNFRRDDDTRFAWLMGANFIVALDKLTLGGEVKYWWTEHNFDGVWVGFNIGVVF